jgi:hypothetical protein
VLKAKIDGILQRLHAAQGVQAQGGQGS